MARPTTRTLRTCCVLAVVLPVLVMVMVGFAPSAVAAQQPAPQSFTVSIRDFAFSSADLAVHVGDTVTWVNEDRAPHDVTTTSAPASFASGTLGQGQSFSYTFGAAGSYSYLCTIHPDMVGTVTAMDHEPAAAAEVPAQPAAPAEQAPAESAPVEEAPAEGSPAEGDPASGAPAEGAPVTGTAAPATSDPAAAMPAPGVAPTSTLPAPVNTQVVGAAQEGRQLDPMIIIVGVALGVATLCLLLISPRSTSRR